MFRWEVSARATAHTLMAIFCECQGVLQDFAQVRVVIEQFAKSFYKFSSTICIFCLTSAIHLLYSIRSTKVCAV